MAAFYGSSGNDFITPTYITSEVTRLPGEVPSSAADVLYGNGGNDYLDGGGGADTLDGGSGNDGFMVRDGGRFLGGHGDDGFDIASAGVGTVIDGGTGIDVLYGSGDIRHAAISNLEQLALGPFGVTLTGAQLSIFDTIVARTHPLTGEIYTTATMVLAGPGSAATHLEQLTRLTITGSSDAERLSFTTSSTGTRTDVYANGNFGDDSIVAGGGDDSLLGSAGDDTLGGSDGNDTLGGGSGNDRLLGGSRSDSLLGSTGDDLLVGGADRDRLSGGSGADRFRYASAAEGGDTISDFTAGIDDFEISAAGFGGGLVAGASLSSSQLLISGQVGAVTPPGIGRFVFNPATSNLSWDADGSGVGAGVVIAKLTGVTSLATSDFILI
jgi:Ca2+-binding RTX toxin-like protein